MTQLLQAADLRGAARLSTEAVAGLAGLVEAMRSRVATPPQLPMLGRAAAANEASAETLLGWLAAALAAADPHLHGGPEREAILAALNGLLGDHLAATRSPLAIPMAFRHSGGSLLLDRYELRSHYAGATPRVLVLLHELCMNDLQWQQAGHDHGEALARELGYTPVYLHYNSGLSVSTNGRILAQMMERLYDVWPVPVGRLAMMGHGMGGLVARSAIHHGALLQRGGLRWPGRVNDLVCLGTPHQGAPLGRAGQDVDLLLGAAPYAAPLARLGKLRSAGINDLRLGNVLSAPSGDDGTQRAGQVGLPGATRCFAVAASLGPATGQPKARLPGDGLVPVPSALGQHGDADCHLDFDPELQAIVPDTGHLELLSSPQVYGLLRLWLA
ncbi:hypothetical protein J2X20_004152 [Pelomonas saccharophila]|uniref:GPI inositol-deacylase PGAP1-like alpha/beta domain-containing protein n=1 Tax=Roseateles saccharophilus TaxID=304 RepID=A0ABU1YRK0_ROSSA|nr:alpha/beta hydrolase [Roseateles saccharophilus]MDR7271484.1 hypothetical protein [Roseateles saccharophilus]